MLLICATSAIPLLLVFVKIDFMILEHKSVAPAILPATDVAVVLQPVAQLAIQQLLE